ncbi:MAG: type II secretion system F family protein [Pirellulales bacterium]
MPDFAYIARDPSGRQVTGTLSANTQREAMAALGQRSLFPVRVEIDSAETVVGRTKRIKAQLMTATYGQLADLLRGGVPLLRSIEVLRTQSSHRGLTEVLNQVHGQIQEGKTLAEAMARYPRVFNEMAINMVRAGGEGGFLEEALDRVADFTEKQEDLKSRTLGAIAYPAFLAVVGFSVVTILIVFFVPKFETMFDRLRQRGELPAATEWLLWISATTKQWWWLIIGAAVVLGIFARMRLTTDAGRLFRDRVKIRLPMAGGIFLNLAVARFCRVLGTLLHNGVPIIRSLEISSEATGNRVLSTAIQKAAENISAGQSLAKPLEACHHFPPAVVEMIAVAEESNNLESVLISIADGMERRTWRQLELFVRLLEPIMLLILASVVLVVVIALLLPVIKMSTTL